MKESENTLWRNTLPRRHEEFPCHRDRTHVMSLLILLSIPAISAILCMVAVITNQTVYLRLQNRSCRVIPFPVAVGGRPRPHAS